jgi:NCAIR mutase (PurE)-related protein
MNKANDEKQILKLLELVQNGQVSPKDALLQMQISPFKDLGYANIDYRRGLRQGVGEIIYGQGKTP